ncbi:LuxR C-terminal-related transcriptional regulator [Streptomyces sp. NPDC005529]|uniref:LuxR C-terminal-related transcriptional regulator n=1 Tax=unclassified Streptomyces TaxID=2593676 RepID=UPI0033A00564
MRRAHSRLTALGATPFAERVHTDLAACDFRSAAGDRTASPKLADLTDRAYATARLAAAGNTNQEIAKELLVSAKTVEYHLSHVFAKLGLTSRRQLRAIL